MNDIPKPEESVFLKIELEGPWYIPKCAWQKTHVGLATKILQNSNNFAQNNAS